MKQPSSDVNSYLFEQEETFFNRAKSALRIIMLQVRASKKMQLAVFLALSGIFSSGYGFYRLVSDSHLVCSQGVLQAADSGNNQRADAELSDFTQVASETTTEHSEASGSNQDQAAREQDQQHITIDISGAVKNPGLYSVELGSRIGDGIAQAGGIATTANAQQVAQAMNLAEKLKDGQKIYVPFAGESYTQISSQQSDSGEQTIADGESTSVNDFASESSNQQSSDENQTITNPEDILAETQVSIVSINTASSKELMELKGIGEKRAADIVAGRPYDSVADLLSRGILTNSLYESLFSQLKL